MILTTNEEEVAMKPSDFFSKILKFRSLRFFILCQKTQTILLGKLYIKLPRIIVIASKFVNECFSFNKITIENALSEISMLYM